MSLEACAPPGVADGAAGVDPVNRVGSLIGRLPTSKGYRELVFLHRKLVEGYTAAACFRRHEWAAK